MLDTDCERIGDRFLSQPVNALTSLAFLPAGYLIVRRRPERAEIALLTALVGTGSFLAHGPRWRGSHWLHDVTIVWILAGIGLEGRGENLRRGSYLLTGALFGAAPLWNDVISGTVAAAVIARELVRHHTRSAVRPALALAAAGAVFGNLWRTGSPLCDPHSVFQGHGVWHLMTAAALAVWGRQPASDDRGPR